MQLDEQPRKVTLAFAENGEKTTIPENNDPADGLASLNNGFPPKTRQALDDDGIPPFGQDMNGILYLVSAINRWQSAGASFVYDADFSTDDNVNGYPKGAVLLRADGTGFWVNQTDNNETNPDTGGANWHPINNIGITSKTMTGSNVTLTALESAKDVIVISGTLTANVNLIFPVTLKQWIVVNNTSGAFTLTAKTASGTGGLISQTTSRIFYGDGINLYGVNANKATQIQVDAGSDNESFLTPKTYKDSLQLANKANKNGSASNRFKVSAAIDIDDAVRKEQLPSVATTTAAGLVEKATQVEMNAGNSDRFPDAATIRSGFAQSTDSFTLPEFMGGWKIKWGEKNIGDIAGSTLTDVTTISGFTTISTVLVGSTSPPGLNSFIVHRDTFNDSSVTVILRELVSEVQADAGYWWCAIGK